MSIINYRAPNMNTLPALSMPPIEHIYSGGESANKPEIEISKGIQEIEPMIKHNSRQEIYSIQQSIYRNTAYLYRLLYRILSLIEETFNPNRYYPQEYSEISTSIYNRHYINLILRCRIHPRSEV